MGLLDWLSDLQGGGGMPGMNAMGDAGGPGMPYPTPAPAPTQPMPPVQMTGQDATPMPPGGDPMTAGGAPPNGPGLPLPPGTDPMTAGGPTSNGPGLPPPPPQNMPVPTPRPTGAGAQMPPPSPMPGTAPGMSPAPQAPAGGAPANQPPSQTWLGRALGITPDQAGLQGRQVASGLGAGLKSVGDNWNKPGLAAFAGSAGAAMEGGSKEQQTQQKQAIDYLNAAIKAQQVGDERSYKQNYVKYLVAKQKADNEKMASKDAGTNKNDTPTQLYRSAIKLTNDDKEVIDAKNAVDYARKTGEPADIAKAQANLQAIVQAKNAQHFAAFGLHPQVAAEIAKQPGNSRENPLDASKAGITLDNVTKKLQPGQYYWNPKDMNLPPEKRPIYQYKGPPKEGAKKESVKGVPDKPTAPEPPDPMHPYKTPLDAGGSSNDDED